MLSWGISTQHGVDRMCSASRRKLGFQSCLARLRIVFIALIPKAWNWQGTVYFRQKVHSYLVSLVFDQIKEHFANNFLGSRSFKEFEISKSATSYKERDDEQYQ